MLQMEEITKQISKYDIGKLRELNRQVVSLIKMKRFNESAEAILNIKPKMKVMMKDKDRQLSGLVGIVTEVKRVKAVVDFGVQGKWVIPASSLVIVK